MFEYKNGKYYTSENEEVSFLENIGFQSKGVEKLNGKAYIPGHAAVFGNEDSWGDVIVPGAFAETMKKTVKWAVLADHMSWEKVGFNNEAKEDEKGLDATAVIPMSFDRANRIVALAELAHEMKAKDAWSIGYVARDYEFVTRDEGTTKERRVRMLKRIDMWEYSFVTWGANDQAYSRPQKSIDIFGGDLGKNTDIFFQYMEKAGFKYADVIAHLLKKENERKAETGISAVIERMTNILQPSKGA